MPVDYSFNGGIPIDPFPMVGNLNINVVVPPGGGAGSINVPIPDNGRQLDTVAVVLARIAIYMVDIAESIQKVTNEKGGINIKDSLDPYQYEIIKKALEDSELPVPPAPSEAVQYNALGGVLSGTANIAGFASLAATLANPAAAYVQKFFPQVPAATGVLTGIANLPDYSGGFFTVNASLNIIAASLAVIANSVNKSVDSASSALILKGVLSAFQIALTEQSNKIANKPSPPRPPDI
jgi:hypothetical protein